MRLIDANNIDFVILEDSLHRIEHRKGDEIDCVIGAQEVKAIPIERLEQIEEEILGKAFSIVNPSNTYEYINVIDLKSLEEIIEKALEEQGE